MPPSGAPLVLEAFGRELWLADGPIVRFLGLFPYATRMAVARLADGGLWIWSPIAIWKRRTARLALRRALAWNPGRLVVAHGACAESGGRAALARGLRWLA